MHIHPHRAITVKLLAQVRLRLRTRYDYDGLRGLRVCYEFVVNQSIVYYARRQHGENHNKINVQTNMKN